MMILDFSQYIFLRFKVDNVKVHNEGKIEYFLF